jgi:hypothetical protein
MFPLYVPVGGNYYVLLLHYVTHGSSRVSNVFYLCAHVYYTCVCVYLRPVLVLHVRTTHTHKCTTRAAFYDTFIAWYIGITCVF